MDPAHRLDLDGNLSAWLPARSNDHPQPALRASIRADVAIVGGGFTGISTAYNLSRRCPEKRIVLLEARHLANGASGRSGGQMLNWIYGTAPDPDLIRYTYQVTRSTIDAVFETIAAHSLAVSCSRGGVLHVQTTARGAEAAHAQVEQLGQLGIPLEYVRRTQLGSWVDIRGAHGAILDRSEGQINGVEYLRAMRSVLLEQGVAIYEDTPVLRVREGRTVELTTPGAQVHAASVVLAANAYTPRLGYFGSTVFPVICRIAATPPLSDAELERAGWRAGAAWSDDTLQLLYVTRTEEGRIVFGGGPSGYRYQYGSRTTSRASRERGSEDLRTMRQLLGRYLPGLTGGPLAHHWTGPVAMNVRGLSGMIGVRGEHRNVFYGLGYSGHGIVLANLAGRILTDRIAGDDHAWRRLPIVQPCLPPIPPEPLRWAGIRLYMGLLGGGHREGLW